MSEDDRYETYEPVPVGYDLLAAKSCELDCYGIPPRPTEPHLLKFWKKLVSPPFHGCPAKLEPPPIVRGEEWQTQPPNNLESSLNWSGALISPPWPKRINLAVAGWIVPEVSHPSPPALFTRADAPKTLIWVGLDGHNARLPNISCPQIGTFHTPDGRPEDQHFPWLYWWRHPRQGHADPQEISRIANLQIDPGQKIMAGLWVMISGDVSVFIKNQSSGQYRSLLCKRQPLGDIEPLGSSAEWIVERPTDPHSDKLYPLADYGSVDFKYCMGLAADKPDGPCMAADKPPEPDRLVTLADNGTIIKMREAFADPYRTVYISRAKQRHDEDGSIGVTCTFHAPA